MAPSAAKKSARNKKRSLRKEKLGHQLPSSRRRNRGDFFAGLAEDEPAPSAQAEAAALLGTTEKAIETRIYRARNRLRERVKNFEGFS